MASVDAVALIKSILRRPVAYHPVFAEITGYITAALMLSQAWYWTPRTDDADGWFYKTRQEWTEETGMSRTEQETARKRLVELNLLEEELRGMPAKMHFRVNTENVVKLLAENLPTDRRQRSRKPAGGQSTNKMEGNPPTVLNSDPETTTQTTSKTTTPPASPVAKRLETKRQIEAAVNRIFNRWQDRFKDVLDTGQYKLTPGVQKMIGDRLRSKRCQWTEDNCYEGIEGLRLSRYHMGDNSDHKKYLAPKYVFEDDDKLQRFVIEYRVWLKDREAEDETTARQGCRFCGGNGFVVEPFKLPADASVIEVEKWAQVDAGFKSAVSQESYENWFAHITPEGVNCTRIYLRVPSFAVRDWLSGQYRELLGAGLRFGFGPEIEVQWIVGEGLVPCTADVHKRG